MRAHLAFLAARAAAGLGAILLCLSCAADEREAAEPGADELAPGRAASSPEVALLGEGLVSTRAPEFAASFSPDARTLYFNRASPDRRELRIMAATRVQGGWEEPRTVPFSGSHRDLDAFVTPDGERIYFNSDRPAASGDTGAFDIWYVDRTTDGWGPPVRPGAPLNSDSAEFFTSATRDGDLYFTSTRAGSRRVYRAAPKDGGWSEPEPVSLGSMTSAGNPLVAPDGGFLVLTGSGPDGSVDLFVSCRSETGWQEPLRLPAPINSAHSDFAPGLDPGDGTLLFTSERPGVVGPQPDSVRPPGDIYRTSLRPAELCRAR